ncbi:MAG: hypothetical protein AAGF73_01885 [Actinomycetota bacterium]
MGRSTLRRASTLAFATAVFATSTFATTVAEAGTESQTVTADERGGNPSVVVVGDSLTADNAPQIDAHLRGARVGGVHLAALGGRRIDVDYEFFGWNNSGRDEIARLRASGVDPLLWIVELGTNDLRELAGCGCADPAVVAGELIDVILDAVGERGEIVWVTVHDREAPIESAVFNSELRRRVVLGDIDALADWSGVARSGEGWFLDRVHPNHIGAGALAGLYADAIDAFFERRSMTLFERMRFRFANYA